MARILLIDDDFQVRQTIGEMLRRLNHEVVVVSHGGDGIEALDWSNVDLVISDIMMPERDGLEVITHIRSIGLTVPIIAISGGGLTQNYSPLRSAKALGATASLAKPFSLSKLRETVAAVVQR